MVKDDSLRKANTTAKLKSKTVSISDNPKWFGAQALGKGDSRQKEEFPKFIT